MPDLDAAEFHCTRTILETDRTSRMPGMLNVDGFRAVQHHDHMRSAGRNLVGIPLAACFKSHERLGDFDNGSGSVGGVGTLVEYIHLVRIHGGDLLRIFATNKDAAVGIVVDPELGLQFEVRIRALGDEKTIAFVGLHNTVDQLPIRIADHVEGSETFPIEECRPTCGGRLFALSGGLISVLMNESNDQDPNCNYD